MNIDSHDDRFANFERELSAIVNARVVSIKDWHANHARPQMRYFRATGILIIVLSSSVPFLAAIEGTWADYAVSAAALSIAALTGLNAFFNWHRNWQGYRQTQFALEFLLTRWELAMAEARRTTPTEEACRLALAATESLVAGASHVSADSTSDFFGRLDVPES